MRRDKISLIVVMSGPDATAGSTLNLYKRSGIMVPANVPIISVARSEEPTRGQVSNLHAKQMQSLQ